MRTSPSLANSNQAPSTPDRRTRVGALWKRGRGQESPTGSPRPGRVQGGPGAPAGDSKTEGSAPAGHLPSLVLRPRGRGGSTQVVQVAQTWPGAPHLCCLLCAIPWKLRPSAWSPAPGTGRLPSHVGPGAAGWYGAMSWEPVCLHGQKTLGEPARWSWETVVDGGAKSTVS